MSDRDPPIVFTLGSAAVHDPGPFFDESAKAAALLERRAVLLVGPEPGQMVGAGPDVAVFGYAPFSKLFPRAAAVVHQGGSGTTGQVMRAGRPMLIVPLCARSAGQRAAREEAGDLGDRPPQLLHCRNGRDRAGAAARGSRRSRRGRLR